MPAFFAYRSPYDSLLGKHVCRLEADTVLGWFQQAWGCAGTSEDEDEQYLRAESWLRDALGTSPYGLSSIFTAARRDRLAWPRSEAELFELLREHLYVEGDKDHQLLCQPGALQVYTDDDNLDVAYYFCDQAFLEQHGPRAAFLLHEPWRLPAGHGLGGFENRFPARTVDTGSGGEGETFLVATRECGKCEFETLAHRPPVVLPGVLLPELTGFLRANRPGDDWPEELVLLWSQVPDRGEPSDDDLRDALDRVTVFSGRVFAYLDEVRHLPRRAAREHLWERRGEMRHEKYLPNWQLCRVSTSDHLAQLCWCIANAPEWAYRRNVYNQYLFDDRWVSGNPELAAGLLRFATRWDVLSAEESFL
jgi:hypothetical protein